MRSVGSLRRVTSWRVPSRLDGFCLRYGHDRANAPAMAGHVGDPASYRGLVQDLGQGSPQFADADLNTCGRRHTQMVAPIHLSPLVYTCDHGARTLEPP